MAAYISFGVSPAHLLSASVMSAPAALASAKLLLPETQSIRKKEGDETVAREQLDMEEAEVESPRAPVEEEEPGEPESIQIASIAEPGSSGNLIDAATQGASSAALLVLNITAIVVAFIAFVAFLNSLVSFFGGLIGHPEVTFEWLLGKFLLQFIVSQFGASKSA